MYHLIPQPINMSVDKPAMTPKTAKIMILLGLKDIRAVQYWLSNYQNNILRPYKDFELYLKYNNYSISDMISLIKANDNVSVQQ